MQTVRTDNPLFTLQRRPYSEQPGTNTVVMFLDPVGSFVDNAESQIYEEVVKLTQQKVRVIVFGCQAIRGSHRVAARVLLRMQDLINGFSYKMGLVGVDEHLHRELGILVGGVS